MDEQPFPNSLCHHCQHVKRVTTKTSVFLMCTALPDKYPRQPVLQCAAHQPTAKP